MADGGLGSSLIKICGITRAVDVEMALGAGATGIGVVLAPSARRVTPELAAILVAQVGDRALSVAVFRDVEPDQIAALTALVQPHAVQLHDPPPAALLDELRGAGLVIVRAIAASSATIDDVDDEPFDAVLLDGTQPGSGQAHGFAAATSRPWHRPLIAAGGLTSSSVREVAAEPWVWGVDVSSGVEASPGVKDSARVHAFVDAARAGLAERS
ncbi:MAG: phosphoribosylanthranilate isomerase [Acidimicrobiales bacterium]